MRWRVWRYREGTEVQGAKRGEGEGEGLEEREMPCYTQQFQPPCCEIRAKDTDVAERDNTHKKLLSRTDHPSAQHYGVSRRKRHPPPLQLPGQQIPPKIPTRVNSSPNLSHVIHSIHSVPSPLPPPTRLIPTPSPSLSTSRPPAVPLPPPLPAEASAFQSPALRDPAAPVSLPPVAYHARTPSARRSCGGARVL